MRDLKSSPRLGHRILLWFGSVGVSIALFSLLFYLFFGRAGSFSIILLVARITAFLALPVAFLYLPIVFSIKNADDYKVWIIMLIGTLIGPAALLLRGLIQTMAGEAWQGIWRGDVAGGLPETMTYACIVGFLASGIYSLGLRWLSANGISVSRE